MSGDGIDVVDWEARVREAIVGWERERRTRPPHIANDLVKDLQDALAPVIEAVFEAGVEAGIEEAHEAIRVAAGERSR